MTLFEKISYIIRGKIPLGRQVFSSQRPQAERQFVANTLTVDRLQSILRSAERGDCRELFDLYRDVIASDSHAQSEFAKRKIVVICEQISALPIDKDDADDVRAAEFAQGLLNNIPEREAVFSALLDSTLWPFSVAEKIFKPSYRDGLKYELDKIIPVPYRLIDLRSGNIKIFKEDSAGNITNDSFELEKNRYIVHRGNILTIPSFWGGPMRALLFWWLFSAMNVGWWAEFLEKFGTPFLVGKYDVNDDDSRNVLSRAFSVVKRLGGIIITKDTEIEVQNALSSQNGDSFEKFLAICNREKSKLILGQTLSAEAQATGLGSGVASSHESVRADIKTFDCVMLARTLREQLVRPFLEYNGIRGAVPNIVIGQEDKEDTASLSTLLSSLASSGLRPTDSAIEILSQKCGFQIERAPATPPLGFSAMKTFSADTPAVITSGVDAAEYIARSASAEIAQKLSGSSAAIQKLLETSTSPADFDNKLQAFCKNWPPEEVTALIQEALISNVLNSNIKTK